MIDAKVLRSFVTFKDGEFYPLCHHQIPEVLLKVIEEETLLQEGISVEPDISAALSLNGGVIIETFGLDVEYLYIWKFDQFWYIEYWDGDGFAARIVVDSTADYLELQAKWLNQMATKIMAAASYHRWRDKTPDPALEHEEERVTVQ